MLVVLHPTYTLRLEIQDRSDVESNRWFNGLTGKTGCDEVLDAVQSAIKAAGIKNFNVYLERFEHKP